MSKHLNSGFSAGAFARLNNRPALKAAVSPIVPGCHYVTADYGFLPLPGIGTVKFRGRPIGPGNTDTIYRRLEEVGLSQLEMPETIPIELIALSVGSIEPVIINGAPFDMHIRLTPGERSFGEMSVLQELADDGSGIPNGLFHKNINIHFTCHFTPVGSDKETTELATQAAVYISTVRPGTWGLNPWPDAVTVTGTKSEDTANFFITSSIYMLNNAMGPMAAGGSKQGAKQALIFH